MYMDKKNIKIIDHIDQLNNDEYHKIPQIPISTLNDYYLQQIYKMDPKDIDNSKVIQNLHSPSNSNLKQKSICEDRADPNMVHLNDNDSDIMSDDDPNTVKTRYTRHQSTVNLSDTFEDEYNPLTPLIDPPPDAEDTKCGFCSCNIL